LPPRRASDLRRDGARSAAPWRAAAAAHRAGGGGAGRHRAGHGARDGAGRAPARHPRCAAPAGHHDHRREATTVSSPSRAGLGPLLAAILLAALGALAAPEHAAAQHRATFDFGVARITQANILHESVLTLAYYLESRHSRLTFASSGIGSLGAGGVSAAQGGVGAFWRLPRSPLGLPELSSCLSVARIGIGEPASAWHVALLQAYG